MMLPQMAPLGRRGGELNPIARPDLGCEVVPDFEIARAIGQCSPFKDRAFVHSDAIRRQIVHATGELLTRRASISDLRCDYLAAAALLLFARHLLHIEIDEPTIRHFERTMQRSPYCLRDPLRVIFKAGTQDSFDVTSFSPTIEVNGELQGTIRPFRVSPHVRGKLEGELCSIRAELQARYSTKAHFEFVGFCQVCVPFFNLSISAWDHDLLAKLKSERGAFYLQIPACLMTDAIAA
jgi:hypothetical protein